METPKPTGGRPRRRPFAAHDARAVVIRARNAISWLQQLRWALDGHPEVLAYWQEVDPSWQGHWRENEALLIADLNRLLARLSDPVAPDKGASDA